MVNTILNNKTISPYTTLYFLLLPGAELPLVESFGLLNDHFPFPSILDAGYPVSGSSNDKCAV